MKVGRVPRNEIISVHFSVGNPSNMDTTGRNPQYHAACETLKATPTTTVEEPHEVTLVPHGAPRSSVQASHMHAHAARSCNETKTTLRSVDCLDDATPRFRPAPSSWSPVSPPSTHTWTRPEEEGRSRRTCAAGQAYRDVVSTIRHNIDTA